MRRLILAAVIFGAAVASTGCYRVPQVVPLRPVGGAPTHTGFRHPTACPAGFRPIGYLSDGKTLDCVPD